MPREKKKPNYNAELIMREFMETIVDAFGEYDDRNTQVNNQSLNAVAEEFGITSLKTRKLLITAEVYSTAISREINRLFSSGSSIQEIMAITGLSRASVHSYFPYTKIP